MKLKTYLRGLGIGIIVTTIVMVITLGGRKKEMSDEEIIARAKELGMVESVAEEPDANNESTPKETERAGEPETENLTEPESIDEQGRIEESEQESVKESEPESIKENEPESVRESESEPQSEKESEPESQSEPAADTTTPSNSGEVTAGVIVNISIASGDDSATVSRRLEELELVISATQFDRFLCDNGYAKRISPGDYEIAMGSSEETIAKIITKSR